MIKIKVLYDSPKDPCKTHWINIWQQYKENIRCNIVRDYRTLILQLAYFSLADFNILYFFGIVLRISCTLSYLLLHLSFPFYHCHYSTADYFRLWIFIRLYILVQLIYVYTLNLWTVWFSVINNTIGPMSEYTPHYQEIKPRRDWLVFTPLQIWMIRESSVTHRWLEVHNMYRCLALSFIRFLNLCCV